VLAATPPRHASLGAAVLNASRQTGGALGVALLGGLAGPAGRMTLPMATVTAIYLAAATATTRAIRA
jgi:MFS transporter, DHA2 family, methylenomycin A resistance protein